MSKPDLFHPKVIQHEDGNIYHGLKKNEPHFKGFGEAYFSTIKKSHVKAWKKHTRMQMNLIVPVGAVKFVFLDAIENPDNIYEFTISKSDYARLHVPPGWWMGFSGLDDENLILNIADIMHDPSEIERKEKEAYIYSWEANKK